MICYPWKIYAEYEDGEELLFTGNDEAECMGRPLQLKTDTEELLLMAEYATKIM